MTVSLWQYVCCHCHSQNLLCQLHIRSTCRNCSQCWFLGSSNVPTNFLEFFSTTFLPYHCLVPQLSNGACILIYKANHAHQGIRAYMRFLCRPLVPKSLAFWDFCFTSNVWASTSCCIHKYLPAMCFILPDPVFWVKNRAPLLSNRRLKPVVLDVKKFTAILDEQCIWNTWTCWIPFGFCGTQARYLLRPTSEVDGIAIDKVNGTAGWFSTRECVEGVIACGRFLQ